MATSIIKNSSQTAKHHYVRTIVSSFFGFLALTLIIISIVVVWLDHTLTNTNQYVRTVAPLVKDPDVQQFVISKATESLTDNKDAPVHDVAVRLLGEAQVAGKTDDQLRAEVKPIVQASIQSVVISPQFATLWQNTNRDVHGQLLAQLKGGNETIKLNFQPLITGVISELSTTKLSFIKDNLDLPDDVGVVVITGRQLDTVRKVYDYFTKAMLALLLAAVLAAVLAVVISVHHWKTLRRIALSTGIFAAVLAMVLSASALIRPNGLDPAMQNMAAALVNGITLPLRTSLIVVAVVCITGAVVSKVCSSWTSKKSRV